MNLVNIPDSYIASGGDDAITYEFGLTVFTSDDKVKFCIGDICTSRMGLNDGFIERIQFDKLNPYFLKEHLAKEIEIRNVLDGAIRLFSEEKYAGAVRKLDEVLYYDPQYGRALLFKSRIFCRQGHFVKSLRHYKKAVKADSSLRDVDFHRLLLSKSSEERDNFPKIKSNIYAGDEYFSRGDFEKALQSYDKALANPTNFKNKILSKLLNKKATALLRLDRIDEAIEVFKESVKVKPTDYAYFHLGIHDYYSNFEAFNRHLRITKKQLFLKAKKLNEVGEIDLACKCLDEFFDNHYAVDEDYVAALNLKVELLKKSDGDAGEVEQILSLLRSGGYLDNLI